MPATKLDVLIVSYNTRDELAQTLSTLMAHPPSPPVELLVHVLDNGSTDGSPELVSESFPEVDLVRSETNLGFGKAMNALARRSRGRYLLLLNSDVIVERDICSPLIAALEHDRRSVVAAPRLRSVDGSPQFSANRLPTLRNELARALYGTRLGRALKPVFDAERLVHDEHQIAPTLGLVSNWCSESIWATCWLLRSADFPARDIFDESFPLYDEDLDFCFRMRALGRTLVYVPSTELVHIGGASSTHAIKSTAMVNGRHQYYLRHGGRVQAALYSYGILTAVPWLVARVAAIPKPGAAKTAT